MRDIQNEADIMRFIQLNEKGIFHFYTDSNKAGQLLMNIGYGEHQDDWKSFKNIIDSAPIIFKYKNLKKGGRPSIEEIKADYDKIWNNKADADSAYTLTHTIAEIGGIEILFRKTYNSKKQDVINWYHRGLNGKARWNRTLDPGLAIYRRQISHLKWHRRNSATPHFENDSMAHRNTGSHICPHGIFDHFPNHPDNNYIYYYSLPLNAQAVLMDIGYNSGPRVLNQFIHLKEALQCGDWEAAILHCNFQASAKSGGVISRNNRRQDLLRSLQMHRDVFPFSDHKWR